MFKLKDSGQRSVEIETENKKLKRENDTLKRENAKLKLSLDEAARKRRHPATAVGGTDCELQRELIHQLSETRKQLLNVQDRLTVAEQVTAATQRRELVQEGADVNLPTESDCDYEELRFDPTQEHIYAALQLTTHTGCIIVFDGNL